MKHRSLKQVCGLLASAAIALVLIGCNGKAGQNGLNGTNGAPGTPAPPPSVDAILYTPEQWAALEPIGTIKSASVPATGNATVTFTLTDKAGNAIKGLEKFTAKASSATLTSYPNLAFAIAKLVPEDATTKAPSKWVSYIVTTAPNVATPAVAPTRPSTDNTGTLTYNSADGSYTYTFYRDIKGIQTFLDAYAYTGNNTRADLGNVTFDGSLVHRVTMQFSGAARGTGSNTADGVTVAASVNMENPINVNYDFVPTTGAVAAPASVRDIVNITNCNDCHEKLAFHGGGRVEARYCVVCHTDQRKYGYAEATLTGTAYNPNESLGGTSTGQRKINGGALGDMPAMVHRIHRGTNLSKTGYNYANVFFDKLGYSMLDSGERMCIKCHSNASQSDNFKTKPTRLACGTCHDNIDFATGANIKVGGVAHVVETSDVACAGCHKATDIPVYHQTLNVTPHNPTVATGLANFTYSITSAAQATSGGPVVIKFKITKSVDGGAATPVVFEAPLNAMANPLLGFTGSPSFQLAWAMTQDGITAPSDFNNLVAANGAPSSSNYQPRTVSIAALLDPLQATTVGTLSAPDATTGVYTATIVGAARIFPAGAKLRQVGLQGYFTQLSPAAARHAVSVVANVDNSTASPARRKVIDNNKCANCHEWFEGHGGNRVFSVEICVQCHVPGLTTSGKGIPDDRLEAYRAANLFTAKDTANLAAWGITIPNPVTIGSNFGLAFPQTSNNMKDMIHGIHAGKDRTNPIRIVRNRTNATAANGAINVINGGTIGFPGILNNCQSCHTYNGYDLPSTGTLLATREEAINVAGNTTTALAASALAASNAGDLMITPFTAACVTCHDGAPAKAHMVQFGGQIKVRRLADPLDVTKPFLNSAGESCSVCHSANSELAPSKVHK